MKKITLSLLLALLLATSSVCSSAVVTADATFDQDSVPVAGTGVGRPLNISAQAYALLDAQTGLLVLGERVHDRLPMASTTKIMTALITLEQPNLDEYFTVSPEAIRAEGSSMGLMEGDQVTLRTLAYGMLLSSGNDAANAAAVRISGSVEQFAVLMNQRASNIGMEHSNFVTPSGLDAEQHYSSAYDMGLLAIEALKNHDFAQICAAERAQVSFGNPPFARWLTNHNRLLKYNPDCIGVKTGFTKKSGRCLVSAAERPQEGRFVAVTLNAPNDWNDHQYLLDYGFSQLVPQTLTPDDAPLSIPVVGGESSQVALSAVGDVTINTLARPEDFAQRVVLRSFAYAPVQPGDHMGEIQFESGGMVVGSVPLVAAESAYIQQVEVKLSSIERIQSLWQAFLSLFRKEEQPPLRS